jgi:hypothetical protein
MTQKSEPYPACLFSAIRATLNLRKTVGVSNATVRGLFYMANPTNWLIFEAAFLAVVLVAMFFIARAASRQDK